MPWKRARSEKHQAPSRMQRVWTSLILLILSLAGSKPARATAAGTLTQLAVAPSGVLSTKTVVTLTATVQTSGTSSAVTQGTVLFFDVLSTYAGPSGTGQPQPHLLGRAQVRSNGTAVFATILPSATHTLYAVYTPTPQGLGSSSATATVTVTGGGHEVASLIATAGGVKNAYTIQSELRYQGVTAPTGTFTITDNTTSTTLATTTHIADQGATHAGYGYALATAPNASGAVSLADMDGDGIPDMVAASGSTVSVLHGVGDGTYNSRVDYTIPSGGASSIDTGDVNNDGYPDVVISDSASNAVNVFLNNGSGGLNAGIVYTVTNPAKVLLGDFGSGYLDIATLQSPASPNAPTGVNILRNSGTGSYGTPALLDTSSAVQGSSASDFTVGDFDADGHLDIMVMEGGIIGSQSAYTVFLSDASGGFRAGMSNVNPVRYSGLVAADLNDDGLVDVALGVPQANSVTSLLSNGNGSFQLASDISAAVTGSPLAGDFNGDGRTDLVLPSGSQFYVAYDNKAIGGRYVPPYLLTGPTNSPALGTMNAGFILGDGLSDFVFAGATPAEWLSYLKVTPVYPAASTSEQPIPLSSTTSLAPHSITVTFQPVTGGSYGSTTSNIIQFAPMGDVTPALTLNPATIDYNTSTTTTTLTATMQTLSGTPPTGTITFYDNGGYALGSATLSGGTASLSLIKPDGGTHSITALYSGDSNYLSRTSAASTLTVIRETPSLQVVTSQSSQIVAGTVTLTGTISAINTNVAGVVLNFDIAGQNTASCTITTAGASGSCAVQSTVPSNGSLQAHVSNPLNAGAQPNLASATASVAIAGTQAAGHFTLQSSVNPSYQGQSVTITVTAPTVGGVYPNGNLNIYDNGTLLQTISFAGGNASQSFTSSTFSTGSHTLTTHYDGDTNGRTLGNNNQTTVPSFLAGNGAQTLTQQVVTLTVSLPVTVTPQNTNQGTLQTISVTGTASGVAIAGATVEFHDALASPTLLGYGVTNSSGIATFTQLFSPGQHSFYVVVTAPVTGQSTHTSSAVSSTVTPTGTFPLALNLSATGAPGNYVSTVTATYHGKYPLGPVSLLNVTNANTSITTQTFGAPSFVLPTSGTVLNAGVGAFSTATGDVNGDGKIDLVVGNYFDDTFTVYLGNGDGTFQTPITSTFNGFFGGMSNVLTDYPNKILLRDLDGDGNLDLVVSCDYQNSVNVFSGDGTGHFLSTFGGGTGGASEDFVITDFDKDGQLDFVTADGYQLTLGLNQGNSAGTGTYNGFSQNSVSVADAMGNAALPRFVTEGDFNNDSNPDVVTGNTAGNSTGTGGSIAILLGQGTTSGQYGSLNVFGTPSLLDVPGTPSGVTVGDFDEDGNLDIAVSLGDTQKIAIFFGNGNGTFRTISTISSVGTSGPQSILAVDYDGDGSLDLLMVDTNTAISSYGGSTGGGTFTSTSSGTVLFMKGDGQGNFDPPQTISTGAGTTPYSITVADFDNDGLPDLAVPQTAGFDNLNNTTSPSTVSIFLGSNQATSVLTGSSPLNSAGPVQVKAQHVHTTPDAYATTNSNTVQLQSLTTAAVSSSANPSPLGSSLTLTTTVGTVGGVIPTGTVQFFDGSTSLGTVNLSSGVANLSTSSLVLGGHTITAFYNGDTHFQAVSASALAQTISPAATTVVLTSSANPATFGASVTLTATLGNGAATGTVLLRNGSTQIGSAQISSGVATFTTTSLPLGTSSLTARYLGDSSYSGATSTALSQQINQSGTATVSLVISPASATYGSLVTMTATLAAQGATGSVTFLDGSNNSLGTASVQNGTATFSSTALPIGSTSVTASYSGDTLYSAHTSSAMSVTITQATLSLNPPFASPASGVYAQSIVLTQVMPSGATGTVTFLNNGVSIGSSTIANGVATLATSSLPVATNTITASYGGNTSYSSATTGSVSVIIAKATPALAAPSATSTNAAFGTSITLTQAVPSGVTGTVSFYAGATLLGTGSISAGVATLTTTSIPVGTQSITAVSTGNSNFNSATSAPRSITITPPASATGLNASTPAAVYGTAVTFTATVTSNGSPVTTGTVDFQLAGVSQGISPVNGSGVATLVLSNLNAGTNAVIANFSAAGSYAVSASSAVSVTITQATPSLAAPSASPASASYGTSVTLTQTVPAGATGTVTFFAGGVNLGSATIAGGVATLTTTTLAVGTNSLSTNYAGNTNFASATSAAGSIVISQATPSLAAPTASPATAAYGTSVTLTQAVPSVVTGTLTFYAGSTSLGTATISGGVATLTATVLPGGTNSITTVFGGNANVAGTTSAALSVTITQATPALAAPTASPTAATVGASVTLTQVVPVGTTGSITFFSGSTNLGTGTISGGVATLTTTSLPIGTNALTSTYAGNGNYTAGTSAAGSIVISAIGTSTSLNVSPATSTYGTSVTLTATVTSGGSPVTAGSVSFRQLAVSLGTVAVNGSGVAVLSVSNLSVGTNVINANYVGSGNYGNSISLGGFATVNQVTTVLSAPTPSPASAPFGSAITLTQTVPAGATGTITFLAGGASLGTGTIAGGVATFTTSTLPVGSATITSTYPGNVNFTAATSPSASVTITQALPALAAPTASPTSATYGSSVTLTQVVPAGATGTVTFYAGGVALGTATISGGVATLSTTALPGGVNALTAAYSGNTNFAPATSAAGSIAINPATLTLPVPVASPASAVFSTSITLTETVPTGVTGAITFFSGTASLGSANVVSGVATLSTTTLPTGANAVTASYSGNANFTSAVSPSATVTITPAPTTTTLTVAPPTAVYGSAVTLTATITGGGGPVPGGTVSFQLNGISLGTATVAAGTATLTVSSLNVGTDSITASFAASGNFAASASVPATATVTQATPVLSSVAVAPSTPTFGNSVTLTQTVPAGATGTVTFSANGAVLGTATIVNGVATLLTSALQGGTNSLSAAYSGNANYIAATSSGSVSVSAATLTLAAPVASPATASYGSPVTLTQSFPAGATGTANFTSGSTLLGSAPIVNGVATLTTSGLPVGSNAIVTAYPGNSNYLAGNSPAGTATVTQTTPSLAAPSASPSPATFGAPVTLTQSVPAGATGTVTFSANGVVLGTGTISNGTATLSTTVLVGGTNSLTAAYSGNANYSASSSAAGSVLVSPAALTLSAPTSAPANASFGSPVTLTQTVPPGATGTITFSSGSTTLGTATIVNGVATLTTTALPVGSNPISSTFPGNANYTAASGIGAAVTITQSTPTLSAPTASPANPTYGATVTLTQVLPAGATGTVTFSANGAVLGTATISNGVATLTTAALPGGTNSLMAAYGGNSTIAAGVSAMGSVTVSPATPVLASPVASPATATFGSTITLTQAVPSGATGTITFSSGSTTLGTAPIVNGVATLTTSALPVGTNPISTSFPGNANYTAGTGTGATVTIGLAAPALAPPAASPANASYGTSVTLTQTVPSGATGVVTFIANGTVLGTATITNGVASLTTTAMQGGTNSVIANYGGSSIYNAAASTPATVTITPATLTLSPVTASPSNTTYGTPTTLTQVFPTGITGTATFASASGTLGTASIFNGVATLPNIALPVGSNTVTASYPGNSNYGAATSTSSPIVITPATATLGAPVASPSGAVYGMPVTFTQTVPSGLTGTVTFTSNNIVLGTATISNGVATLTTSALQGGTNFVVGAAYSGNNNFLPATSATTTILIAPATLTLAAPVISPTTAAAGSPVTLTQSVPSGATGTVTFTAGTIVLGTAPILNGTATLTTAALNVGTNSITGSYPGNSNYTSATSAPASVTISPYSTALAAPAASPATASFGTPVTLTQTVPAGATGTITFTANGVILGSGTIVNGVATLTTTALQGGANMLGSSYSGNGTYAPATSTAGSITITPATLTLMAPAASPASTTFGTSVTLTQSFPAGATGTATFLAGATVLGTATIANGVATLTTAALPVGNNAVSTSFPGNNNFTAASSPATTVTITAGSTTLAAPAASPTTATFGTPITLTQTVPQGATGTVTFTANGVSLGTATISNGVATLTTSALQGGSNSVVASYGGNGSFPPATSPATTITITPATLPLPAPAVSPATSTFGSPVTITQSFPVGATGTVTFTSGSSVLGTATISNGSATLTTTTLQGGVNGISTSFGGNPNFAPATSASASITVSPATLTLPAPTSSPATAAVGSSVTLTEPFPAGATGTVTFSTGSTVLGTATIANGLATLATSSLPPGTDSLIASFAGNNNYTAATSAAGSVTITYAVPPGYIITAAPPSLTIHAGESGSTTLTFTPVGGFTGTFSVACNNLPANATCTFMQAGVSNNTVAITNTSQPAQVVLVVKTGTAHASLSAPASRGSSNVPALAVILPFGFAGLLASTRRRRSLGHLLSLAVLAVLSSAALAALSGCGGGGFGVTATPAGTSTVTVTATASTTASGGSGVPANSFSLSITILP